MLALDVGTKRIGLAISDSQGIVVTAHSVFNRSTFEKDLSFIEETIEKKKIDLIVVGIPYSLDGSPSKQTQDVLSYKESLQKSLSVPVKGWDERLTSVEAEKKLIDANISRVKRKSLVDKVSALLILESFLQFHREKNKTEKE